MDEVLHALMLSGTLQKELKGLLIPAVIENQALQCRRHEGISVREMCQSFHQQHKRTAITLYIFIECSTQHFFPHFYQLLCRSEM